MIHGCFCWLCLAWSAWGHPGGIKEGRASCGKEYHSAETAFVVHDVKEAWYLRRISTCEAPFFWTRFSIEDASQQVYIAAISPEILRFQDQLEFHAVLFGPGLPDLPANALPLGVTAPSNLNTGVTLDSPANLSSCGFVDENIVMRSFSDVIGGRCMEELGLASDYKDKMLANGKYYSWWLYSKNWNMADPGDYYLVSWLTQRGSSSHITGKYEITLGPWSWSGYADDATMDMTQSQVTTCTCASNKLSYVEQKLDRLGFDSISVDMFAAALPSERCGPGSTFAEQSVQQSTCRSAEQKQLISDDSSVEFAGLWQLEAGRTHIWTFRSFYPEWQYPDPSMDIYVTPCESIASTEAEADVALSSSATSIVNHNGAINMNVLSKQTLMLRNETNTSFNINVESNSISQTTRVCIFTQHRPEEFMATYVSCPLCTTSAKYTFPTASVVYASAGAKTVASFAIHSSTQTYLTSFLIFFWLLAFD
jgi:hypothetical protein